MSIITEIKEYFIRGLKREPTEKEIINGDMIWGSVLIVLILSLIALALTPVEFHGKMEIKGDIDINALQGYWIDTTRPNMKITNITLEGDFKVPAYVFSSLMQEEK